MSATRKILLLALSVSATAFSCTRQDPTGAAQSPAVFQRGTHTNAISTVAQFDSAWDNGNFPDGTTFLIASGSTLVFPSGQIFDDDAADDKSFSIVGEDTTAVLKKVNATNGLFSVNDNISEDDTGLHSVTIDNIKLVMEYTSGGQTASFITLTNYGSITITDAVIDIEAQSLTVTCDNLLVDGIQLRAKHSLGFLHRSRQFESFSHTVRNSIFARKDPGAGAGHGPCEGYFSFGSSGTLTCSNNTFLATQNSDGEACYQFAMNTAPTTVSFDGNDLGKQTLLFGSSCLDCTVDLDLVSNNSDLLFCGEDLIECYNCDDPGDDFTLNINIDGWQYLSTSFSYDDFGPVSGQYACVSGDSAYIEFSLPSVSEFEPYQNIDVVYGDDDCVTSPSTATAWFNATTGKWNAAISVTPFTDGDFYWHAQGSICGYSVSGTCSRKRLDQYCAGGGKPDWYTPYQQ